MNNSSLKREIDCEVNTQLETIKKPNDDYNKALKNLEYLRTEKNTVERYVSLKDEMPKLSQKKRKKYLERLI